MRPLTDSYMELRIDKDGEDPLFLRVPTFWDAVNNQWIAALRLSKSKKIIAVQGENSFELQNAFNIELSKIFGEWDEIADEIYKMFKPLCYWKETEDMGLTL